MNEQKHKGRLVALTGGSSGIGQAIALRLASEGAKVAIADIGDAADTIEQAGDNGSHISGLRLASSTLSARMIIIPSNATFPHRNDEVPPWDELSPGERRIEVREMELYAAMVDNLDDNKLTVAFHWGNAYLRQGNWKTVTLDNSFDESEFELFNIAADSGETTDLSQAEPEKFKEMIRLWNAERRRLAARGKSPAAFDRRCIPPGCVARRLNIPDIRAPRALPGGRLTGLGARATFATGC